MTEALVKRDSCELELRDQAKDTSLEIKTEEAAELYKEAKFRCDKQDKSGLFQYNDLIERDGLDDSSEGRELD